LILRGKRFGFSLEEIRQLLDLYHMDDGQEAQLSKSYVLAEKHLAAMDAQKAELEEAIAEMKEQMKWGAEKLATLAKKKTVAA
jgi:DNA-binding transcriptional MerR regulator